MNVEFKGMQSATGSAFMDLKKAFVKGYNDISKGFEKANGAVG